MKTPRLPPDTDLARIAPLPADEKRKQLIKFRSGSPIWSYDPTRSAVPDLVNAGTAMFQSRVDTPWEEIRSRIFKRCKGLPVAIASNLEVAKLVYDDFRREVVEATQYDFGRYQLSLSESLCFWSNVFLLIDGKPLVPSFDFRRAPKGMTKVAARFAASIAHLQISSRYPEFEEAKLLLIQFPVSRGDRSIIKEIVPSADLFSDEQVRAMISETRAIWREISEEREEEARRTGTDDGWWG